VDRVEVYGGIVTYSIAQRTSPKGKNFRKKKSVYNSNEPRKKERKKERKAKKKKKKKKKKMREKKLVFFLSFRPVDVHRLIGGMDGWMGSTVC